MLIALMSIVLFTAPDPRWDPSTTWTVTSGVLSWKDKDLSSFSTYNRKDKELDKTFAERGVPASQRTLLLDRQATTDAVLRAVGQQVTSAPRGSTFIFYFTGHGVRDDHGSLVLATTDTRVADLDHTGLHAQDLLPLYALRGPADRVLLISDACTSGDLTRIALELSLLGIPTASLTSAASQSESTSNWTFTQTLIDALHGRALIDQDHDGALTLSEIAAEARTAMKHREGQPIAFTPGDVPDLIMADAAPWPDTVAALDVAGDVYRRGDWVVARMPDGERGVGRVLGADRQSAGKKKRLAGVRLRLSFFGYADESFGWAREDRVQPIFFETWPIGTHLRVTDDDHEYEAIVLETTEDLHFVHYEGYEDSEDEWVTPDQIVGLWTPDPDDPRLVEVGGREAWVKGNVGDKVCVRYPGSDWTHDECVAPDRVKHPHSRRRR